MMNKTSENGSMMNTVSIFWQIKRWNIIKWFINFVKAHSIQNFYCPLRGITLSTAQNWTEAALKKVQRKRKVKSKSENKDFKLIKEWSKLRAQPLLMTHV